MAQSQPAGYSTAQIALHWIIAALIVFQYLAHDAMEEAYDAAENGQAIASGDLLGANLHAVAGISILALAILRVLLRLRRGAPAGPQGQNGVVVTISKVTHFLLYAAILGMPISGMAAWFGMIEPAGDAHSLAATVLFWLVVLHALGALVEHFYFRTDVLVRMMRPRST